MKVLDKVKLEKEKLTTRMINEISLHRSLKCPHIVELHHYFEDDQNIYMLLEYCDGNELFQEVKQKQIQNKSGGTGCGFTEQEVVAMFSQLV